MKAARLGLVLALLFPVVAPADTIWYGGGGLKLEGVKVTGVAGGDLRYTSALGKDSTKAIDQVKQLAIDGETAFNTAEAAAASEKSDAGTAAMTGYQSVLASSTSKDWIKTRSAQKLASLAKEKGKYDSQLAAYIALLKLDPPSASSARPEKPDAGTPNLDAASAAISKALGAAGNDKTTKIALLTQSLEIASARKDSSGVGKTLEQLSALGGTTPAEEAMLKIAAANVAIDNKEWAKAQAAINQNRAVFIEPRDQADALFALAQAIDGADNGGSTEEKQKEIAVAYVRAAAVANNVEGRPHAAESFYRVGQILEKMTKPAEALQMYRQASESPKSGTMATDIKAAVDRLAKTPAK